MQKNNLVAEPQEVYNIKGDTAKIEFINRFKEVQRLKTQLDQYTDLSEEQKAKIENCFAGRAIAFFQKFVP